MSDKNEEIEDGIATNTAAIASIAASVATLQQSMVQYQSEQRAVAKSSRADFNAQIQQLFIGLQATRFVIQTQQTNTSSQQSSSSLSTSNLSSSSSTCSSPQTVNANISFINTFDKQTGSIIIGTGFQEKSPMSSMNYLNNAKYSFSKRTGTKNPDDFIHNLAGASNVSSYTGKYWTTTKIADTWQTRLDMVQTRTAADSTDIDPMAQITDQMETWNSEGPPVHSDVRVKFREKVQGHISEKEGKYCKQEDPWDRLLVKTDGLELGTQTSKALASDTPKGVCGYRWRRFRYNRINDSCTYNNQQSKGKGGKQEGNGKARNKYNKMNYNSDALDKRNTTNNTSGKQSYANDETKSGFCGNTNHNSTQGSGDAGITKSEETTTNFVEVMDVKDQVGYIDQQADELRTTNSNVVSVNSFNIEPSASSSPSSGFGIMPPGSEGKSKEFQKPASDRSLKTSLTNIPENEGTADVDQGGDDSWTASENIPYVSCRGWRILQRF
jgi:hypothetical protein